VPRRLVVRPSEAVPPGLVTVPATPDEPVGLVPIDLAHATVERRALEVA
jgi:hypothetical protein